MIGSSTEHDDESADEETKDSDDLDTGKDKFSFSVDGNRENV